MPTFTPRFSITAARPFISASISAAKRQKSTASRVTGPEVTEFIDCLISRNPARMSGYYTSAIRRRCAMPILKKGTRTTIPSPVKSPSLKASTIAAHPGTKEKPHLWRFFRRANHQQVTEDTVLRSQRRAGLPHGQRILFPQGAVTWDAASNQIKS